MILGAESDDIFCRYKYTPLGQGREWQYKFFVGCIFREKRRESREIQRETERLIKREQPFDVFSLFENQSSEEMSTADKPVNTSKQSPSAFFQSILGRPVIVKLYSGVTYQGEFKSCVSAFCCIFFAIFPAKLRRTCTDMYPFLLYYRHLGVHGRLHEHCDGANARILQWQA